MPTIITTNPMSVQFDVRPSTGTFILSDVNGVDGVYVTATIPAAGVKGNFTIEAPDGTVIYENTSFASPDYVGSTSYVFDDVTVPTNGDGSFVTGIYTITMRTQIIDGSNPTYELEFEGSYDFQYVRPTVSIDQVIDCLSPLFTSTDETDYTQTGQTAIDNTRVHTIIYPPGSAGDGSPVVGSATTVTTSTFYNGPQTTTISSDIVWTFDTTSGSVESFEVRDLVSAVNYVTVDCTFICSISCCLRSLYNTKEGYRGVNNVEFQRYSAIFNEVMANVQLALTMIACGSADEVSAILDRIQILANCTDDCCGSDTPSLVVGLGGGAGVTVEVVSGGAPVTVTSNTVGDTTTYTVSLSAAFVAIVNGSYNTTITSVDTSVTIVATGSNPVNYDLSVAFPDPSLITSCSFTATITYGTPGAVATAFALTDIVNAGDSVSVPTIAPHNNFVSFVNYWRVSGIDFGTPDMPTKAFAKMLGIGTRWVDIEVVEIETVTNSVLFSIVDTLAVPPYSPTNGTMNSVNGGVFVIKFLLTR